MCWCDNAFGGIKMDINKNDGWTYASSMVPTTSMNGFEAGK